MKTMLFAAVTLSIGTAYALAANTRFTIADVRALASTQSIPVAGMTLDGHAQVYVPRSCRDI